MNSLDSIPIQNDEFKRSLFLSLAVHIAIVILLTIKMVFYKPELIDLSQAIRVDMVGLPDKVDPRKLPDKIQENPVEKPEAAIQPAIEQKKVIEKLPDKIKTQPIKTDTQAIDLNKTKNKQKEAFEKLKKLNAIEKIKQDLKNENIQKQALDEANKKIIKGRVISPGTSLAGLDKIEANNYLLEVDQKIKENWTLPQWLANKPLKARILVKFRNNGQIISALVMQSSGDTSYDNYCLQAVTQSAPFPLVPDKFVDKFSVDGVVIGFPE